MKDSLLPIGTVVLLKDGKKRIMIIGFYVQTEDKKTYDYIGCLYPEGVISSDKNLVFNQNQIDKIFFLGFSDVEEQQFKYSLYKEISKNKKDDTQKEDK